MYNDILGCIFSVTMGSLIVIPNFIIQHIGMPQKMNKNRVLTAFREPYIIFTKLFFSCQVETSESNHYISLCSIFKNLISLILLILWQILSKYLWNIVYMLKWFSCFRHWNPITNLISAPALPIVLPNHLGYWFVGDNLVIRVRLKTCCKDS